MRASLESLLKLRQYNLINEGPDPVFDLYRRVYGSDESIRQRWKWEWLENPDAENVRLYVADDSGRLAGLTVRLPCNLYSGSQKIRASFATNSMVDPDYRRQGIISKLYELAREHGDLQLSKGTAEGMFRQLLKMGYLVIKPDSYMTCLLRPIKWLSGKLGIQGHCKPVLTTDLDGFPEYRLVKRFDDVASVHMPAKIYTVKDSQWLNWRYVDIPHHSYHRGIRYHEGTAKAWCVVRQEGSTAHLVDLAWDRSLNDEPQSSVQFAKKLGSSIGAVKMVAWGSLRDYRRVLLRHGFFPRKETPHFSFYPSQLTEKLRIGGYVHIMHGDGDIDYL